MLAIAGDSAAGKTTLAEGIVSILGPDRVTTICVDDYHRYDREQRAQMQITPLHPECNYMDVMEQHLRLLSEGEAILKPVYNHKNGSFDPPEYISPTDYVVIEGLLPLYNEDMRKCFDATVYLDPPEDLRREWKIKRDCAKRGYAPEQVLAELDRREPDSAAFIRPQRNDADVVVRFERRRGKENGDDTHLSASLVLRPGSSRTRLSDIVPPNADGSIRVRSFDDGRVMEVVEIDGDVQDDEAAQLEHGLWDQILGHDGVREEELGAFTEGTERRHSHPLALTQLLIVNYVMAARARR